MLKFLKRNFAGAQKANDIQYITALQSNQLIWLIPTNQFLSELIPINLVLIITLLFTLSEGNEIDPSLSEQDNSKGLSSSGLRPCLPDYSSKLQI